MSVQLTPRQVRDSLKGQKFVLRNESDGARVAYSFPKQFVGWPRMGLEGYTMPVTCHHPKLGDIPCILKAFKVEVPSRRSRLDRLVSYGLAGIHDWLFAGVPFASVGTKINGLRIEGHVSKHVCADLNGDDLGRLKSNDDFNDFDRDQRTWLAEQLCCAVLGLERQGITHADLSHGNVIIGYDESRTRLECVLIDYDGFIADGAPPLPRQYGGVPLRPLGTPGYQHPEFKRRVDRDIRNTDESLIVENDRFALGVLCCELMVWSSAVQNALQRTELLDPDEVTSGRIAPPRQLRKSWPEGADLLAEALRTAEPAELPGPETWLRALGRPIGGPAPTPWRTGAAPRLRISRVSGNNPPRVKKVVEFSLTGTGQGDFGAIDPALSAVGYRYDNVDGVFSLSIEVSWPAPVFLTRDKRKVDVEGPSPNRPLSFAVGSTDTIRSNAWEFDLDRVDSKL